MDIKTRSNLIFDLFLIKNPNPQSELVFNSVFELLIAVVLSAQATDISVNKVTEKLFKVANTPEKILLLGHDNLEKYIMSIGLFRTKTNNIINLSKKIIENYNSSVPNNYEDLIQLDGVGRKTANVILNVCFKKPTIAVDTHVFRVSNRIGLVSSNNIKEVEFQLLKIIKKKYILNAHNWLVLHGRYICKARNPDCKKCFLNHLCTYDKK